MKKALCLALSLFSLSAFASEPQNTGIYVENATACQISDMYGVQHKLVPSEGVTLFVFGSDKVGNLKFTGTSIAPGEEKFVPEQVIPGDFSPYGVVLGFSPDGRANFLTNNSWPLNTHSYAVLAVAPYCSLKHCVFVLDKNPCA